VKIYTKTGDDGTTGLIGGKRLAKDELRIEAYGTVDECNALLGLAAVALEGELADRIARVQSDLFAVGSHLAAPSGGTDNIALPTLPDPAVLEGEIDAADGELPALTSFILPGGSESAARLHLARCVARRAERLCVGLSRMESVPGPILVYLNRLSDWLFTMARLANARGGVADVPWRAS
jgi:cob(I)alamin adenosyltransferase